MEPEVEARLNGELPLIRIIDRDYIVDWRLRELRMLNRPDKKIDLRKVVMDEPGENYLCFYDKRSKEPVEIRDDLTVLPKDVVVLKIPYELRLDPVAVARDFGLADTDLLKDFPIQKNLMAEVVSLKDTQLPRLVRENRIKQEQSRLPPQWQNRKPRIK